MSAITTRLFKVNGVWQRPADNYQEPPLPIVGYDLAGRPKRQGYQEITFTWSFMDQEDLTRLINAYDPENPKVEIIYIDKASGNLITRYGMFHEPIVGARNIIYYNNVAVKFTRITES